MAIQILYSYISGAANPGACYVCNTPKRNADERVVDFGRHIEMEGFLAICELCVIEAGLRLGLVRPSDVEDMRDELTQLHTITSDLGVRLQAAEALVEATKHYDPAIHQIANVVAVLAETPFAPAAAPKRRKAKAAA